MIYVPAPEIERLYRESRALRATIAEHEATIQNLTNWQNDARQLLKDADSLYGRLMRENEALKARLGE